MSKVKKKTMLAAEPKPGLRYVGKRPFKLDASDDPVRPGDEIHEGHNYYNLFEYLRTRADFLELDNG